MHGTIIKIIVNWLVWKHNSCYYLVRMQFLNYGKMTIRRIQKHTFINHSVNQHNGHCAEDLYLHVSHIATFSPLNITVTSTLKLRIAGHYGEVNSNMIRGLLSQITSKAGSISMSWRHKWCISLIPKEYCSACPVLHPVVYSIRTTGE